MSTTRLLVRVRVRVRVHTRVRAYVLQRCHRPLVVQLRLNPGHEVVNVFRRRAFNWLFDCYTISPQVPFRVVLLID